MVEGDPFALPVICLTNYFKCGERIISSNSVDCFACRCFVDSEATRLVFGYSVNMKDDAKLRCISPVSI